MDYSHPTLAHRLAADYVLGTMQGGARRRMTTLMLAHPALRRAVSQWETRLAPLARTAPREEPSAQLWPRIESRLFGAGASRLLGPGASRPTSSTATQGLRRWWQSLAVWQTWSAGATAAALTLAVLLTQTTLPSPPTAAPTMAQAPIVIVLSATPDATAVSSTAANASATFVASVSADGRALVLRPLSDLTMTPGRSLELWSVPAQGAPKSLGLVQAAGNTTLMRATVLQGAAALAVSVEPAGGSTTGAPSGPVIAVGKLQL
jgi:anti-sigma-K factor RskA